MARHSRFYRTRSYSPVKSSRKRYFLHGIDEDIENLFLSLNEENLERVFVKYTEIHGERKAQYARRSYDGWRAKTKPLTTLILDRLLELVPPALEPSQRFEMVKKLRAVNLRKQTVFVTCEPRQWREKVLPAIAELVSSSQKASFPAYAVERLEWLTDGDTAAVQRLIAAAEEDEARVRLQYLEAEFLKIESLVAHIETSTSIQHRIEIPQGTVNVCITVVRPSLIVKRATAYWKRLGSLARESQAVAIRFKDRAKILLDHFIEHEL